MKQAGVWLKKYSHWWGCGLVILGLYLGMMDKTQAFNFKDETDHLAMGWMMVTYGKRLYVDLTINHQPIPVLWGALVMKILVYPTLFDLIEGIRWSMFMLTTATMLIITTRFRWRGVWAGALTYSVGYLYFGWHVLAESIIIPAVLVLVLLMIEYGVGKQNGRRWIDAALLGISWWWAGLTLLPVWPSLLVSVWWWYKWVDKKMTKQAVAVAATLVGLTLGWLGPMDWWRETVVHNWLYFLPGESGGVLQSWWKWLFYPVINLVQIDNGVARQFWIIVLPVATIMALRFKQKGVRELMNIKWWGLGLVLVGLNVRVRDVGEVFFQGFHLLPYLTGLYAVSGSLLVSLFDKWQGDRKKWLVVGVMVLGLLNNTMWMWERHDKKWDHEVQYVVENAYGRAMDGIRQGGDTLLTGAEGRGYMQIMSKMPLAGRQVFHLEWAYRSPFLRGEFEKMLKENPPTFIYFPGENSGFFSLLDQVMHDNYVNLPRVDGKYSDLKMRRDRLLTMSEKDREELKRWGFLVGDE